MDGKGSSWNHPHNEESLFEERTTGSEKPFTQKLLVHFSNNYQEKTR